jgi:hypothetical protein
MATFGLTFAEIEQNFGKYDLEDLTVRIDRWIGYASAELDALFRTLGTTVDEIEALGETETIYKLSKSFCESRVSARVSRSITVQDPDLAKSHDREAADLLKRVETAYEVLVKDYDPNQGRSTPRYRTGTRTRRSLRRQWRRGGEI